MYANAPPSWRALLMLIDVHDKRVLMAHPRPNRKTSSGLLDELRRNAVLASLSEPALKGVAAALEVMPLHAGERLQGSDERLLHAWFPLEGLLSLQMCADGRQIEVAVAGDEGMFGLPALFGADAARMTAVSLFESTAARMPATVFTERKRWSADLASAVGRYGRAFLVMLGQGAVCNHSHSISQRCARWLLMAQDRLHSSEIPMTQQGLAQLLGIRRPSVSEVAEQLKRQRILTYAQGRISIPDRHGLEKEACVCYSVIRREFESAGLM